jgi:hypothetical protein
VKASPLVSDTLHTTTTRQPRHSPALSQHSPTIATIPTATYTTSERYCPTRRQTPIRYLVNYKLPGTQHYTRTESWPFCARTASRTPSGNDVTPPFSPLRAISTHCTATTRSIIQLESHRSGRARARAATSIMCASHGFLSIYYLRVHAAFIQFFCRYSDTVPAVPAVWRRHPRVAAVYISRAYAHTCTHKMVQYTRTGRAPVSRVLIGWPNGLLMSQPEVRAPFWDSETFGCLAVVCNGCM